MARRRLPIAFCLTVAVAVPALASAQVPRSFVPVPAGPSEAPARVATSSDATRSTATDMLRNRMPSFPELFSALGRDFVGLASKDHLWIVSLGASGAFASHALDGQIAGSGWGRGFTRASLEPGKIVGNTVVQAGAALATYAVGRATNRPRVAQFGAELFRAQIVAQGVTQAIKTTSRRLRPDGTTWSFPSGHTAAAFATATVVEREFGWKAAVPAYAVAAWVAASRMQQERHYLSDVIAGATLGILAGRSVTVGRGAARFAITPTAVPGGVGVSLDLIK